MKPFMRPTDRGRLAPVGWVAEPAGLWAGREVEVVYDPQRHNILVVRNDPGESARAAIAGDGFRCVATDGPQQLWVRDRAEAVVRRLDRLQRENSRQRTLNRGVEPA